ncbi:hypothetical protein RsTz2092_05160 [Deferribacterales bacterium RsTz2092]|nr:hypothetical protein AGMMS49941_03990 [Deferribacterales bacterium]
MADVVYVRALKLLSRRDYFVEELRGRLLEAFPDDEDGVASTVERLKSDKYLDDFRTLASYVRFRANSGYGAYYIRDKLRQKGVEVGAKDIDELIIREGIDEDAIMRQAAKKYLSVHKGKDKGALFRTAMNYMTYRGFARDKSVNILKGEVFER